jgi:pyridoxine 4-dehydrogenase
LLKAREGADLVPTSAAAGSPALTGHRFALRGGREVHRLGFGAMRITGAGIWGPPRDHAQAIRVLRRAVDLGVEFIDTADSYGPDISEELIAEALHPYPSGLVIATKAGLTRGGPDDWRRDARPEHLVAACEGSLKRLRVDCIELYQLHAPDPRVPYEESVGALARLKAQGKIRDVGVSNVSARELERARAVVEIVSVQNRYNLTERSSEPVLKVCEREQIAFLPWSPLSSGPSGRALARAAGVGARVGASTAQVALAWLLAHSPVIIPIPGTASVAHLEENVAAAALRLSAADLTELSG